VRLIAEELASNHTSRHIKNVKEKKRKVVLQEVHRQVEILPVAGLQEEKVLVVMNR
jgi:hypothetical protein